MNGLMTPLPLLIFICFTQLLFNDRDELGNLRKNVEIKKRTNLGFQLKTLAIVFSNISR